MRSKLAALACGASMSLSAAVFAAAPSAAVGHTQVDRWREESRPCLLCHVQANLSGRPVYDGAQSEYETASDHAHTAEGTPCLACHVDHDEQGMQGPVAGKRLRIRPYQSELVTDLADGDAERITAGTAQPEGWTARDVQVTAFCGSCHRMYASSSSQLIRDDDADGGDPAVYTNHPLRPARDGAERSRPAPGMRLAAIGSASCRACHAAGDSSGDFPHSTPRNVSFLVSAREASEAPSPPNSDDADGVCLRCHRWRSGGRLRGVGEDW